VSRTATATAAAAATAIARPCPSCDGGGGLSRRRFLQGTAVLAGATALAGLPARYAFGAGPGDVLVVLSLRGGFDGLSALVPGSDADYRRLRPTIGVPATSLLPLDRTFGLHPQLAPLKPLWDAGTLALVHAVGAPDPTRSHFDAQRSMEAAGSSPASSGWLDRHLAAAGAAGTFAGVAMGSRSPLSLAGPVPPVSMGTPTDFGLSVWDGYRADYSTALAGLHAGGTHPVDRLVGTTLTAVQTMRAVTASAYTPSGGAVYDDTDVGRGLRDVAQLVKAGIGLRVATMDMGDWDMHDDLGRQGGVDGGRMHDRLHDLGRALAAFAADTALAGVTVVTLSEFGRRAQENGSGGVDHGHGNAVFVLGGGVRGGKVYGRWPGLAPGALVDGDLAGTTDYRAVLSELLVDRCGASTAGLAQVFPGWSGPGLDLARPL